MEINIVDGVVVLILLFFAIRSFIRGIIQEVLNLLSLGMAIYLTMYSYGYFTPFYTPYIESNSLVIGASVVTALVIYLIVFYIISFVIDRILSVGAITPINKTLGFLFGIIKGLLVLSIVYMGLASIVQDRMPKIITDAQTEPFIRGLSNGLAQTFPDELRTQIVDKIKQVGTTATNDPVIKDTLKQGGKAVKDAVKLKSGAEPGNNTP